MPDTEQLEIVGVLPGSIERRTFEVAELRVEEGDKPVIAGHAAVFESLSDDLGNFREKIARGAFADSIARDDVRALFNHDPSVVLGRNRAGTLSIAEDERGLAIRIEPPDTQGARDLLVSIARGDISQMSFGFRTITDEWAQVEGETIRTLKKVRLFDVSPVTFPAYPQTDVALRSMEAWQESQAPIVPWRLNLARRRLELIEKGV